VTKEELKKLLQMFKKGKLSEQQVIDRIASLRFESLGYATLDHHRQLRQGFPEVILCEGKTPQQVAEIASRIYKRSEPLLATRASVEHFKAVKQKIKNAHYHQFARVITANEPKKITREGNCTHHLCWHIGYSHRRRSSNYSDNVWE
jgi:NCAIR mutase (PurE)-related protein